MSGPLHGVRIIELGAIGPAPFCAMLLADHGAEVVRIERPDGFHSSLGGARSKNVLLRSRSATLRIDLKSPAGVAQVRELCRTADGLIEGFRPGVMERLGLGPEVMLADNPRLVFGRMTGWGQSGPYAHAAGHDINYIALSGVLHAIGRAGQPPAPPLNLVGDYGGGGLLLAFGMLAALVHARDTGVGQVVDAAMTDGAALLASAIWALRAQGAWHEARGTNLLDSGAPFYDVYETADGSWVAIGAIEPQFYALLLQATGLENDPGMREPRDPRAWSVQKAKLAGALKLKTRQEWCDLLEGTDACFAPVLSFAEAFDHPHNQARKTFIEVDGVRQPAPAPRYSVTATDVPRMPTELETDA
jgi:alpha-methylacyl-CoA racemase